MFLLCCKYLLQLFVPFGHGKHILPLCKLVGAHYIFMESKRTNHRRFYSMTNVTVTQSVIKLLLFPDYFPPKLGKQYVFVANSSPQRSWSSVIFLLFLLPVITCFSLLVLVLLVLLVLLLDQVLPLIEIT